MQRRLLALGIGVGFVGLFTAHAVAAATRYVWLDAPASTPPYTSWETAATNIADALDLAADGDTVWVTNGVYGLTDVLQLTNAVTVLSVNGMALTTITRLGPLEHRIFVLSNAQAVVDGFTITNGIGRAAAAAGHSYGGGLRIFDGTVRNCRIIGNTCRADAQGFSGHNVHSYGGGIYMTTGTVESCELINNTARGSGGSSSAYGGGIDMVRGTVTGCYFLGNQAYGTGNGEGRGGGVRMTGAGYLLDSEVHNSNVRAANNVAPSYGGGLYLSGNGLVSNVVFAGNNATFWSSYGGGVHMLAGTVTHCRIVSNFCRSAHSYATTQTAAGGGVYMTGGLLRNSLIAANRTLHTAQIRDRATVGAGIWMSGGRVEHCTVSRNWTAAFGRGDGIYMTGGEVWNTIAWFNYNDAAAAFTVDHENIDQRGGTVNYSCTTNATSLTGVGNGSADPLFHDRLANDFRLLPGSPCIDAAAVLPEVHDDLNGLPRPVDGTGDGLPAPDIGAHEAPAPNSGPLRAGFTVTPDGAVGLSNLVFQAAVAGANTNGLQYYWDFTGDGIWDVVGVPVVPYVFPGAGYYDVTLLVSNSMAEAAWRVEPAAVRIFPTAVYVATDGAHAFPYDSQSKAATNLQAAVNAAAAGTAVVVGDGVYPLGYPVIIRRGVRLTSLNGPAAVAVQRQGTAITRLFLVMHRDAVLEGMTLRNAYWQQSGMAFGGAVWMTAGLVQSCVITNNTAHGLPNQPGAGGGVYLSGGRLRNCLVAGNTARANNSTGHGGGIYMSGGYVENCTVVTNFANADGNSGTRGGGIRYDGGAITNTIVTDNRLNLAVSSGIQISINAALAIGYSCSPELTHDPFGTGNITNAPAYRDAAGLDFRLTRHSPCTDSGAYHAYMEDLMDLDGAPRVMWGLAPEGRRLPDRGAYEYPVARGTWILVR